MKISLPSFAIVAAWSSFVLAQAPPTPTFSIAGSAGDDAVTGAQPAAPLHDAQAMQLVEQAAVMLARHPSISARVRYRVDLFGAQTIGTGTYLQQGLDGERRVRLELKTPIGNEIVTLQQVVDGRYLWQFSDLGGKASLTRVDLRRVRMATQDAPAATAHLLQTMAIGGLPQLLDGLHRSFIFTSVEAGELEQMPVWIASGSWRPEALAAVSEGLARQAAMGRPLSRSKLPAQLPEHVVVYLGRDDLFPYRVEYLRRPSTKGRGEADDQPVPILIAELYELRFDGQLEPRQFTYDPGKLEVLDGTESFLKTVEGSKAESKKQND